MQGSKPWGSGVTVEIDPYADLAAAVLGAAIDDLHNGKDTIRALDALFFWLDDGPRWFSALGFDWPFPDILEGVIDGRINKIGRPAGR